MRLTEEQAAQELRSLHSFAGACPKCRTHVQCLRKDGEPHPDSDDRILKTCSMCGEKFVCEFVVFGTSILTHLLPNFNPLNVRK